MRYDLENVNDDELIDELGRTMIKVRFFEPEELLNLDLNDLLSSLKNEDRARLVIMTEDDYDSDADVMNEVTSRYHKKWR